MLQNQIFDFVKTLQVINLTESELALFSATLLVRPGKGSEVQMKKAPRDNSGIHFNISPSKQKHML